MDINFIIHKKKNKRIDSPRSFLKNDLYKRKKIKLQSNRMKVSYENFKIPQINEPIKGNNTIAYSILSFQ